MAHFRRQKLFFLLMFLLVPFSSAFAQSDDSVPRESAITAMRDYKPTRPTSWRYEILLPTNNSALGCPLTQGTDLGRQVTPYRYTFIYPDGEYVVYVASDGTVVQLCDSKFTSATVPTATPNVAIASPTPASAIVPTITPNVPPTAIPSLATTLQNYACPPNFVGYLTPRLKAGERTARVGSGGLPNTLRSQPVANDSIGQRLGTIQPSRTLDRVLNGPACSGGIVWWYVEIDAKQGWTAESNANDGEYYLEPTPGNEVTTATSPSVTAPASSTVGRAVQKREDTSSPNQVVYTTNETILVSEVILGATPEQTTYVLVEYDAQGIPTDKGIASLAPINDIQVLKDGTIAVSTGDGTITLYDASYAVIRTINGLPVLPSIPALTELTPDGKFIAYTDCPTGVTLGVCPQTSVSLRAIDNVTPLWSFPIPQGNTPIKLGFNTTGDLLGIHGFNGLLLIDRITGVQQGFLSNTTPQFGMLDFAFNPTDGNVITTICKSALPQQGCAVGEVTLWSTATNQPLGIVETNNANPLFVRYDNAGTRIFVADSTGTVVIRNAQTGELLDTLQASTAIVPPATVSFDISPEDTQLAVVTIDGKITLWEIGQ